MRPGRQRVEERDPAVRHGLTCRPRGQSENVVRRQDDVQQGVSTPVAGTDLPSTFAVDTAGRSAARAHARNSASVVPLPSNVLHSAELAATNILVPGLTVHDAMPLGPNGATVPPRFQHPNVGPPVPKEFWALGV